MPVPRPDAGTPTGAEFVSEAAQWIGTPYVWGGESPKGFDCSGLVQYTADQLGLTGMPRTSEAQWGYVQHINANQLQPGDLVFLNFPGEQSPGHVMIYAGGSQVIQAPAPGQDVQKVTWTPATAQQWGATIVGYGRIPGVTYGGQQGTTGGPPGQSADTTSFISSTQGAIQAAGGLLHDSAQALNFVFEFFKPGQSERIAFGAVAVASGYGAVRMYQSEGSDGGGSRLPLAILFTGGALLAGYMAARPWPQASSGRPVRAAAYVHDILGGQPPSGPPPSDDTQVIEYGLIAVTGVWAASKLAQGFGALAGAGAAAGGALGSIWSWVKGLGGAAEEVPAEVP